jgi:hypothetical protein
MGDFARRGRGDMSTESLPMSGAPALAAAPKRNWRSRVVDEAKSFVAQLNALFFTGRQGRPLTRHV